MKTIKYLILKTNHFLFRWYYTQAGIFFHKWPLLKSISLLCQNYNHLHRMYDDEVKHNFNLTRDNDKLRAELYNIEMSLIASDEQIDWLNKNMGMKINKKLNN